MLYTLADLAAALASGPDGSTPDSNAEPWSKSDDLDKEAFVLDLRGRTLSGALPSPGAPRQWAAACLIPR